MDLYVTGVGGLLSLCILCAWGYLKNESFAVAVLLIAICVPVEVAFKVDPFPRIGPARIMMAILIATWLLNIVTAKENIFGLIIRIPFSKSILAFAGAGIISTVFSIHIKQSIFTYSTILLEFFAFYIILIFYQSDRNFRRNIHLSLFFLTFILCILSVVEQLVQYNPLCDLIDFADLDYRAGLLRVRATFFHPIAFGCYLAFMAPLVLSYYYRTTVKQHRFMLVVLLFMMTVALLMTVSRIPLVIYISEITAMSLWRNRHNTRKIIIYASLGLCLLSSALLFGSVSDELSDTVVPFLNPNNVTISHLDESSSEYYRIALLKAVVRYMHGARWLIGYGPGVFYIADIESRYAGHDHILTAADSFIIKLLFEHGITGLAAFVFMVFITVLTLVRKARRAEATQAMIITASYIAITGFFLQNITVSMYFIMPLGMLHWLAVVDGMYPDALADQVKEKESCNATGP